MTSTTKYTPPKPPNLPTNIVEWAGLLSTQNFTARHPEEALHFLRAFAKWQERQQP